MEIVVAFQKSCVNLTTFASHNGIWVVMMGPGARLATFGAGSADVGCGGMGG